MKERRKRRFFALGTSYCHLILGCCYTQFRDIPSPSRLHLQLLPPADRLQKSGKLEADLLLVGASAIGRALLSQLGQTGEMIGIIWQDSQEKVRPIKVAL
jgi:hypothetical protein